MNEVVQAMEHPSGVLHDGAFISSAGERVYAAIYQPKTTTTGLVLLCPSWGMEAKRQLEWSHRMAHDLALRGAAAVVLQWPGTEDSEGDPNALTLDRLVTAGIDAAEALRSRSHTTRCCIVGTRVGAAPAALIAESTGASHLVLVQPVLDLAAHLAEETRLARRARVGARLDADWAFGHPVPRGLQEPGDHDRVLESLRSFGGDAVVVRYRRPSGQVDPAGLPAVRIWGEWTRSATVEHHALRVAATRWINRAMRRRA